MHRPDCDIEYARIGHNLGSAIELTEFGLALRRSVLLQQGRSEGDAMAEVMRDLRRAKEVHGSSRDLPSSDSLQSHLSFQ
jgi:hypothetical protein